MFRDTTDVQTAQLNYSDCYVCSGAFERITRSDEAPDQARESQLLFSKVSAVVSHSRSLELG